jgi:hypothetical protein
MPASKQPSREGWFLRRPLQIENLRKGLPDGEESEKLLKRLQHNRENLDAVVYALSSRKLAPDRRERLLEILRRHQRALDECLNELGLARPEGERQPLSSFNRLDLVARAHLAAILGVTEEPAYYEVLDIKAEEYLAQREAFESIAQHEGYKERQTLSRTARKAALVLTLSGSLIQVSSPDGSRGARRYLYQNIYGNAHPPEGILVLDRDIRVGHRLRSVELTTSPVRLMRVVDHKVSWKVQSAAFERISRTLTSLVSRSSSQLAAKGLKVRSSTGVIRVANLEAAERVLRQEYGEALDGFRKMRQRFLDEGEADPHRVEAELLTLCHFLQTGARELGFDSRPLAELAGFVTEEDHLYRTDPGQPGLITLTRGEGPEVVFIDVSVGRQTVTREAPLALIGRDGGLVHVSLPVRSLQLR